MWSAIRPAAASRGRLGGVVVGSGGVVAAARGAVQGSVLRAAATVVAVRGFASRPLAFRPAPAMTTGTATATGTRFFSETATAAADSAAADSAAKKPAAKKPAAKKKKASAGKKSAGKKSQGKKSPGKKAATQKRRAAKLEAKRKAALAKKARNQARTPEAKRKALVRDLKKAALLKPPTKLPEHPWILFVSERTKGTKTGGGRADLAQLMPELSREFKALPPLELQRLHETAEQNRAANQATLQAWVAGHPVSTIVDANAARQRLNRLLKKKGQDKAPKTKLRPIPDDRQPRRPLSAFSLYVKQRWESGQFAGRPIGEAAKTIGSEWKSLPASERQPFEDRAKTEAAQYKQEVESIRGSPSKPATP